MLHAVVHIDRYAIGGLIYFIGSQDLSMLGYPQSMILQQLMEYWLSDAVQSNMSYWGATPLLPAFVSPPPVAAVAPSRQPVTHAGPCKREGTLPREHASAASTGCLAAAVAMPGLGARLQEQS